MVAVSFDVLADQKRGNIKKALKGTVLLGQHSVAAAITTLVGTAGTINVANTYESVGWISEDGLAFSTSREMSEIRGWGSAVALRRDIRSEDRTLAFTALETKRLTYELKNNRALSGAAAEMTATGEWKVDLLARPDIMWWRVLALGVDGVGSSLYYTAKVYHQMLVTEMDEEAWSDGDSGLQYGVTMAAVPDDVLGTLGTEFIFGPGALAAAEDMGLTVATP